MDSGYKVQINKRFEEVKKLYVTLDAVDVRIDKLEREKERLHNEMNRLDYDMSELTIEMEALYELEALFANGGEGPENEDDTELDLKKSSSNI